ncbi:hypothetical protein [Intestinimonas butyriciproducens]|uniref:hypothetical protein n=1 Tax=Intestinimonas butyriciproducens TaxID=1297617 RepID=UPI0009520BA8|nr:hypothetical protein [Intestinimonas butyriciproducens]MCR1905079.1 hypothetical protein [Intestinimonas butyriciproducens]OLR68695.1 hypothetical protein BIV19_14490 [Intestinimonas butyriciproducens]QBB64917.1 hypothetical protein SRB521_00653 [Intestinimonas butyriciproducens]
MLKMVGNGAHVAAAFMPNRHWGGGAPRLRLDRAAGEAPGIENDGAPAARLRRRGLGNGRILWI